MLCVIEFARALFAYLPGNTYFYNKTTTDTNMYVKVLKNKTRVAYLVPGNNEFYSDRPVVVLRVRRRKNEYAVLFCFFIVIIIGIIIF